MIKTFPLFMSFFCNVCLLIDIRGRSVPSSVNLIIILTISMAVEQTLERSELQELGSTTKGRRQAAIVARTIECRWGDNECTPLCTWQVAPFHRWIRPVLVSRVGYCPSSKCVLAAAHRFASNVWLKGHSEADIS